MTYQSDLKKHLSAFKRDVLAIAEAGTWRGLPHEHILPVQFAEKNLFAEAEAARVFLARNPAKRHKDFHHLNSSQAFAFNLFFPFFESGETGAAALLRALGQGGALKRWEVEAIPDVSEGSNLDVLWETSDGVRTVCEVKLTEGEFGKAQCDAKHREKLHTIYNSVLTPHLLPAALEETAFFRGYQIHRNIWHMVQHDYGRLLFLLPWANKHLWKKLDAVLAGVVPATRARIRAVAIEDAIAALSDDVLCPESLRDYAIRLGRKYLLPVE